MHPKSNPSDFRTIFPNSSSVEQAQCAGISEVHHFPRGKDMEIRCQISDGGEEKTFLLSLCHRGTGNRWVPVIGPLEISEREFRELNNDLEPMPF